MDVREIIAELLKSAGGAAIGDAAKNLCKAIAAGDAAAVAALLVDPSGATVIAIMLLAGGVAFKKGPGDESAQAQLAALASFGEKIEACLGNLSLLADLVTPIANRTGLVAARLPGYEKKDLAVIVVEEVRKVLESLLPQGADTIDWDDVRIYLDDNSRVLDALYRLMVQAHVVLVRIDTNVVQMHAVVVRMDTNIVQTHAVVKRMDKNVVQMQGEVAEIKDMLATGRAQLPTIPEGVVNNFASASVCPNPDFVGRADLIVRVHDALLGNGGGAEGNGVAVLTHALSADGGVGKTEIALAYVFDEEYAPMWEGVWWLDASTIGVENAIEGVLRVMGYDRRDWDTPKSMRAQFATRLGTRRHLVVLDNIDDAAVLAGLTIPATSRVLVTTRLSQLPPALATTINVDLFAMDDAKRLLVMHRADLRDEATRLVVAAHDVTIGAIAEELGRHALAVALAAAALRLDAGLTPDALLERLRSAEIGDAAHPLADLGDDETGRKYGMKVAASLLLHLPDLEKTTPLAAAVLHVAALCHGEAIPFSLLCGCLKADEADVRKAVFALRDRSIVRFDASGGVKKTGLLDVHLLTQSAVRQRMGKEAVEACTASLVGACKSIFDNPDDPANRPAQAESLPHAEAIIARRGAEADEPSVAALLNQMARFLNTQGRASEAKPMYVEALAMCRRLYKGDHPNVALSLNNLAGVRQVLGRASEAEPMFVEALAMRRRLYKGDHPDVALSLNNLACVWHALDRASEAEPMYVDALAMRRRLYKGDHPAVARSLNNLAAVRQALDRVSEAEPMFVEAMAMRQRLYKGDHPDVASSLNNLSFARVRLGKLQEARAPAEEAVAMAERCLPQEHSHRKVYENNLAIILRRLKDG